MVDLLGLLKKMSTARYSDVRLIRQKLVEVALREKSADVFKQSQERVVCRAVSRGYGVASTNNLDAKSLEDISKLALKQARLSEAELDLLPVEAEKGERTFPQKKIFEVEEVLDFLKKLKDEVRDALGKFYSRSEFIASYSFTDSTLITSEGTHVVEKTPLVDIFIYLVAKDAAEGVASKGIGGRGGFEVIEENNWREILGDLTRRAIDATQAGLMVSMGEAKKYTVILDNDCTGALAHEAAHMLEADIFQKKNFQGLKFEEPLEVVDNPTLRSGYGSFHWDDEGVPAKPKVLLCEEGLELLHTRLTARPGQRAGNAHGVLHMPRPLMSNVYIRPHDWQVNEILEETRFGIYARGILKAESVVAEGRFELSPEIGYVVERGEIKQPIKHLRIVGNIKKAVNNMDALGKDFRIRPNIEKGFPVSEGGPHTRIRDMRCI
nr:TldD/PmbA family protein [Candidatus Freyarchaeota archaeon]